MTLSLNKVKLLRSLQQKKFRQKYDFFIAEGPKICTEALSSGSLEIIEIFALSSWIEEHTNLLLKYQSIVTVVSEKDLQKVSALKTSNLVLILAKTPNQTVNHSLISNGAHLFCDGIQDPGNLGTIIRIVDWFGFASITLGEGCVDAFNPKTVQSTMGSFLRLTPNLIKDDYDRFFNSFDHIYGAVMQGENLYETSLNQNALYIIGNESRGISKKVKDYCTKLISIPKQLGSGAESLNAAVATGIICNEVNRQNALIN